MPNKLVQAAAEGLPVNSTTGPAAAPVPHPTYAQMADAMLELETPVYDMVLMADIAADMAGTLLNRPDSKSDGYLMFRITDNEREKLLFAINDVEARVRAFKSSFMSARYGKDD